jgi:uncharacterized iron-regulated protein
MIKYFLAALIFSFSISNSQSQTQAFKIFDKEGLEVSFESLAETAGENELIFFGELHNNSITHWLQLRLLKELHRQKRSLILSGEFFERDDQLNIVEWFSGNLTDKNFEAEAKLWKNYLTDYKPMMLYAKNNSIPFFASNIPRKYASLVSRTWFGCLG